MRIFKSQGLTLVDLKKGDLFEKDCNNPCTIYLVVGLVGLVPTIQNIDIFGKGSSPEPLKNFYEKHMLVCDLKNSCVRYLPNKQKVTPLEEIGDGIEVGPKT